MEKFTKLYKRFADEGLSPNEQVALAYMYDRMDLSEGNSNFYDNQHNGYYITYSRSELAKQLNVSEATVTSIFNKLVTKGWLIIKRRFNSTNRIFLPKSLKSNNSTSKIKKVDSNYTKHIYTDKTITNTTVSDTNVARQSQPSKGFDNLAMSLITKSGLSPKTVEVMQEYANGNPDTLYGYAQMLFLAKKSAFKNRNDVPKELKSLEHNYMINQGLDSSITRIMQSATKGHVKAKGYLFKSFLNVIESKISAFNSYINGVNSYDNHKTKNTKKPEIPMFKIGEIGLAF
ncbi:hypothetical protein AKUG0406_PHAGE200540 (plasmid) [Apilactobacillus kunkeei]|nr:hypothetical protein AKUG0406_PHAGE200540 [Apilactobacillus kunkeei]CAI2678680.1 hypothetical protein AKUG0403_PHAGE200550 [Apilactobacillus kunkeei]CAI2681652.1 hypothetical protein AKUG0420_PHAGE200550 [Apilactobacillus kunkeei]